MNICNFVKWFYLRRPNVTPYWRRGSSAESKESNTESCLQNSSAVTPSDEYWNRCAAESAEFWNGVLTKKSQRSHPALNLQTYPSYRLLMT